MDGWRSKMGIKYGINKKKAANCLHWLRTLKSYGAPKNDLKAFYCAVIRTTLEYGTQVWQGNLTIAQRNDIERVQKQALTIIFPEYGYNGALRVCNLKTLQEGRDYLCIELIKKMSQHSHKLHSLLPRKFRRWEIGKLEQKRKDNIIIHVKLKDSNAVRWYMQLIDTIVV